MEEKREKEPKKERAKMTRYSCLYSTVPKKQRSPPRV